RLRNAQMVRLGYNDFSNSLRSFGTLWGALFVRSVSRAEKVVSALTVRGYRGSFYYPTTLERLKLEDLILIFFAGFLPLVSFIFGLV
ncbi:MAG: hypothetical protein N2202_10335, partial [Proteobacteria bacterium]|nr:hypothetical protein [Pseudomonadota bacterium]